MMSKEFQRIKERSDVRKQFLDFIGNSIPRAVGVQFCSLEILFYDFTLDSVSSTIDRFTCNLFGFKLFSNS